MAALGKDIEASVASSSRAIASSCCMAVRMPEASEKLPRKVEAPGRTFQSYTIEG